MAALKFTLSPLALPSKMSVEAPLSAVSLPVKLPPALFSASVDLRSPIGVCIVSFQVPSADICHSLRLCVGRTTTASPLGKLAGPLRAQQTLFCRSAHHP